jgi:hypothetical protein
MGIKSEIVEVGRVRDVEVETLIPHRIEILFFDGRAEPLAIEVELYKGTG